MHINLKNDFRFCGCRACAFCRIRHDEARDLNIPKRNSLAKRIGIISMSNPAQRPTKQTKMLWPAAVERINASSYRSTQITDARKDENCKLTTSNEMTNLEQDAAQPQHKISDPPSGFHLVHNAVSNETWEVIQRWLSSNMLPSSANEPSKLMCVPILWETGEQMQGRVIAQFGSCKYDYTVDDAVLCDQSTMIPIPSYIRETLLENEGGDDEEH